MTTVSSQTFGNLRCVFIPSNYVDDMDSESVALFLQLNNPCPLWGGKNKKNKCAYEVVE